MININNTQLSNLVFFLMAARIRYLLLLPIFVIYISKTEAQVSTNYTFAYNGTTVYASIAGTVLQNGAAGLSTNAVFPNIPIGFTFKFNCVDYTTCGVSNNGFIWFGTGSPDITNYTPLSSTTGQTGTINGIIAGYGLNITGAAAGSRLRYQTLGSAPNRTFTVEWLNVYTGAAVNATKFEIKLYETSNKVEIIQFDYPYLVSATTSGQVGMRGCVVTDFVNRKTSGASNWCASLAGTLNTDVCQTLATTVCNYPSASTTQEILYTYNFTGTCACSGAPAVGTVSPASSGVCSGGTQVLTLLCNPGSGYTYQWKESSVSGGPYSNVVGGSGATTASYTTAALASDNYYVCAVTCPTSGLTTNSSQATVSIGPNGQWVGITSSAWATLGNWCGGVPTLTTNVIIPSSAPFMPAITTAVSCRNLTINGSGTLTISGGSLSLYGDLTNNGTYNQSAGTLIITGSAAQSISGTNAVNVYNMTMSKSGNSLTLNRAVTVNNILTLTTGIINTTLTNLLTINTNGSVTGANNSSFVNGPVRYTGANAFTYPVGKGSDYQPLGFSATPAGGVFWTEAFQNGCTTGCLATGYTGPNGTWTVTTVYTDEGCGFPDYPNVWYVSGNECGNSSGSCGSVCGATDPSLHLGSTSAGDIGAAYDAGGYCPLLGWPGSQTNARCESPIINCTGKSTITLAFNYIEYGDGALDNATLWYYDGTVWSQLADPAKTSCCDPLCGAVCTGSVQGCWTAYSIALPASANNNANVKIGFKWINNDDYNGADPSFAVDDITLTSTGASSDFTCEYFYADPRITFNNVMGSGLAQIENCEYWVLTQNAGTASKSVTLSWDANSCMLAPATKDNYRVARWNGAAWQNEGGTGIGTEPPGTGTITSNPVSSFSPFTIGSSVSWSLPIELLSFTAKYNGKNVDLNWTTVSETNNDYFTIERSADAENFIPIAVVDGAGNSNQLLSYSTTDNKPFNGINYYRLKQTDFDGQFSYSDIISIEVSETAEMSVDLIASDYGSSLILLQINNPFNEKLKFQIIDILGRVKYETAIIQSNSIININTADYGFDRGAYIIMLYGTTETNIIKFIY